VPHEDGRKRLNYTTGDRMQKYNIVFNNVDTRVFGSLTVIYYIEDTKDNNDAYH
jgi:hypothetical protein